MLVILCLFCMATPLGSRFLPNFSVLTTHAGVYNKSATLSHDDAGIRVLVINANHDDSNQDLLVIGIIQYGSKVTNSSLNFLLEVSCLSKIRIHILVAFGASILVELFERIKAEKFLDMHCASLQVDTQPEKITADPNRIRRIQVSREYQRRFIMQHVPFRDHDQAAIMVVDFDLGELPSYSTHRSVIMLKGCAAGMALT